MKTKLNKQIKAYAGIAGSILAAEKAGAQVYFHDYIPDVYVGYLFCSSAYYDLDIDNDSISDFQFRAFSCPSGATTSGGTCDWGFIRIKSQDSNKVAIHTMVCQNLSSTNTTYVVRPMAGGAVNSAALFGSFPTLYTSTPNCHSFWSHCGQFNPGTTNIIGFKLVKNGLDYFGWIRVHIISRGQLEIMEYAYQQTPNNIIIGGDTTSYFTGISENNYTWSYSQENQLIHFTCAQPVGRSTLSVYDLLGREIASQEFDGQTTSITLDKKGIYLIEIKNKNKSFRKKNIRILIC